MRAVIDGKQDFHRVRWEWSLDELLEFTDALDARAEIEAILNEDAKKAKK